MGSHYHTGPERGKGDVEVLTYVLSFFGIPLLKRQSLIPLHLSVGWTSGSLQIRMWWKWWCVICFLVFCFGQLFWGSPAARIAVRHSRNLLGRPTESERPSAMSKSLESILHMTEAPADILATPSWGTLRQSHPAKPLLDSPPSGTVRENKLLLNLGIIHWIATEN